MKDPIVTIIIATYNSEKTLRKALQSVDDQTFQDWECLVVDGASKDGTIEIVKEYAEKDTRFRYISEPDNGIYDAFNKGWKNAKGEWIYYLGSDDWLDKDGLFNLLKERNTDYAILSGDVNKIRVDGSIGVWRASNSYMSCHQGMVMQRDVIEKMGGFDEKYHILADNDLWVRILNANYNIKLMPIIVANFNMKGASQRLNNFMIYVKERYKIDQKTKWLKYPLLSTLKAITIKCGSIIFRTIKSKF